jgi:transposase
MTIILGIDISKRKLDVYDSKEQKHRLFPNTQAGIEKIIQTYQSSDPVKVIIESTGTYQRLVHKILEQAGFNVCLVNPFKSRCFAKSAGFLTKTDKVDAQMLMVYGQTIDVRTSSYPSSNQVPHNIVPNFVLHVRNKALVLFFNCWSYLESHDRIFNGALYP